MLLGVIWTSGPRTQYLTSTPGFGRGMAEALVEIRVKVGDQSITHRYESTSGYPEALEDLPPEVLVVAPRSARGVVDEQGLDALPLS